MKVQLSITMLVSDREETLKRCLDSLKQLLRELPCELIVVFTGKKKEILDIIHQYTDHVIPFEWCNDFSAARNVGLKAAKGEWFMYLDDDEWFEDTSSICRFFKSGEYRQYYMASYIQRNYESWEGAGSTDAYVARMARIVPELHFESAIHEYLVSDQDNCQTLKYLDDYVHHYGYVSNKNVKSGDRAKRNIPLLLQQAGKEPDNGKHYMQLAQEYRNEHEYKKAEEYARRCLEGCAKDKKKIYVYEFWCMALLPAFVAFQGEKERALKEAERLVNNNRSCTVVDAYLNMLIAQLCMELRLDKKCVRAARKFYDLNKYLDSHKEEWGVQSVSEISPAGIKVQSYKVYVNALYSGVRLKDYKSVREILGMIPWDREAEMQDGVYTTLEEWKYRNTEQNTEILKAFSRIQSENPYVYLQKALCAEAEGDIGQAGVYYQKCCEKINAFTERAVLELGVRNGFDISELLKRVSLEKWNAYVSKIVKEMELNNYEEILEKYKVGFEGYPLYFSCLEQQVHVKLMLENVYMDERLVCALREFCRTALYYYRNLYRDEFFEGEQVYYLPAVCQFALAIHGTLEYIDREDWGSAIKGLRKALDIHPGLSVIIKRLLDYVITKSEEASQRKGEEFETLASQIKPALRGMLERQEYSQAETVIAQLLSLMPDDLEVLKMKQVLLQNT